MDACGDYHALLHLLLRRRAHAVRARRHGIGDRQHVDEVAGERSAEDFLLAVFTLQSIVLNLAEVILRDALVHRRRHASGRSYLQIRVGVRVAVREVVRVVLVGEFTRPGERVHARGVVRRSRQATSDRRSRKRCGGLQEVVFVVDDFFAPSSPADSLGFGVVHAVHQRSHARTIQACRLEDRACVSAPWKHCRRLL